MEFSEKISGSQCMKWKWEFETVPPVQGSHCFLIFQSGSKLSGPLDVIYVQPSNLLAGLRVSLTLLLCQAGGKEAQTKQKTRDTLNPASALAEVYPWNSASARNADVKSECQWCHSNDSAQWHLAKGLPWGESRPPQSTIKSMTSQWLHQAMANGKQSLYWETGRIRNPVATASLGREQNFLVSTAELIKTRCKLDLNVIEIGLVTLVWDTAR